MNWYARRNFLQLVAGFLSLLGGLRRLFEPPPEVVGPIEPAEIDPTKNLAWRSKRRGIVLDVDPSLVSDNEAIYLAGIDCDFRRRRGL